MSLSIFAIICPKVFLRKISIIAKIIKKFRISRKSSKCFLFAKLNYYLFTPIFAKIWKTNSWKSTRCKKRQGRQPHLNLTQDFAFRCSVQFRLELHVVVIGTKRQITNCVTTTPRPMHNPHCVHRSQLVRARTVNVDFVRFQYVLLANY
jgi:hypothetical protein